MSNALAIATVTTALAQIVRTAVQSVLPGSDVLTERPDSTPLGQPRARLFLYQVSPNGALRNNDLPTRAANGNVVKRPTTALDLHYLLAFYGNENDLEPQRMLGAAVRDLHAKPVLMRQMIDDAIASEAFLADSNLSDAVEQIKFTPLGFSLEELSELWSVFFQAPYALSVAYQGTVVLIESEDNAQAALPVLRRGAEDQGVNTVLGPFPGIESIHVSVPEDTGRHPRLPSYPSAQLGTRLTIGGRNLGGETVTVRFDHARLPVTKTIAVPSSDRSGAELNVTLVDNAAAQTEWAAGLYTVVVIVTNGGVERTTNQLPLSFAPKIVGIAPPNPVARDISGNVTLTITCGPQVRPTQRAMLLIADREVAAQAHLTNTGTVQFSLENAPVVTDTLVRLRIDGVDSLPFTRQAIPPPPRLVFDGNQKVTIS
jgi:Pvc16 N-terminal domain